MAKSREQKKRDKRSISSAKYYATKIKKFLGRDVLVFIPSQDTNIDNIVSSFQNFMCLIPRVSSTEKMFPRDKRMKFIFILTSSLPSGLRGSAPPSARPSVLRTRSFSSQSSSVPSSSLRSSSVPDSIVKLLPKKFNEKHLLKPVEGCKICMDENPCSRSRICPKCGESFCANCYWKLTIDGLLDQEFKIPCPFCRAKLNCLVCEPEQGEMTESILTEVKQDIMTELGQNNSKELIQRIDHLYDGTDVDEDEDDDSEDEDDDSEDEDEDSEDEDEDEDESGTDVDEDDTEDDDDDSEDDTEDERDDGTEESEEYEDEEYEELIRDLEKLMKEE